MERTLDWKPRFDERSRQWGVVKPSQRARNRTWSTGAVLDQGSEGACVGFGHTAALGSTPRSRAVDNAMALAVYNAAKKVDEWEGEDYDGTSVLAGAKAAKELGFLKEYRWCFSLNDVVLALSHYGPVVVGWNWYSGMFNTDPQGFIHPTGSLEGGHCVELFGVEPVDGYIWGRNSWGSDWGKKGNFKISFGEADRLIHEQGEQCVQTKVRLITRLGSALTL